MPAYKLTYFNARGYGEYARYLFALAGVEYEDVRVTSEEWAKLKTTSNSPFGQLPMLEVDGKVLCQSHAIAAYLAKEFGFYGKDNYDEYKIVMLRGAADDMFQKLIKVHTEKDETKKAEATRVLHEALPNWLGALEKILQESGGKHFTANSLTLADLIFFHFMEFAFLTKKDALQNTPALKDLWNAVAANPKIAAWREKRPKTEF